MTTPSAQDVRTAVRDLSPTQERLLIAVERQGRAERATRPTRDALIRKGIVERSATGQLVLTELGECVAAVLAPTPPVCEGGAAGCLGRVTDPEHAEAARAGDLSAFPYCPPCRVAAAGDAVLDEPVQGPESQETEMTERTTARGKSGTACTHCGTSYAQCTEDLMVATREPCCGVCHLADTHGEADAAPRVWEIEDAPQGVDLVHTHDQDTGEPVIWHRDTMAIIRGPWSTEGGSERLYWHELVLRGPVTEGRPAPGLGIYRTRGSLRWMTPDGTTRKSPEIPPGALVAVTAVTARSGEPTLRVMRSDGDHGLVLTRQFHEAGPSPVGTL